MFENTTEINPTPNTQLIPRSLAFYLPISKLGLGRALDLSRKVDLGIACHLTLQNQTIKYQVHKTSFSFKPKLAGLYFSGE